MEVQNQERLSPVINKQKAKQANKQKYVKAISGNSV